MHDKTGFRQREGEKMRVPPLIGWILFPATLTRLQLHPVGGDDKSVGIMNSSTYRLSLTGVCADLSLILFFFFFFGYLQELLGNGRSAVLKPVVWAKFKIYVFE